MTTYKVVRLDELSNFAQSTLVGKRCPLDARELARCFWRDLKGAAFKKLGICFQN
jgi:hypothetical protein